VIWLTWRQHRQQALAGGIGLGLIALLLLLTYPGIANTFKSSGLQSCLASPGRDCGQLAAQFDQRYHGLQFLAALFLFIPLLVGLFWGAPLVAREMEQGTYRLAWTQSVTRRRWFSTKIALIAGGSLIGAVGFAAIVTWWSGLFVRADANRFSPGIFDIRGIVPAAYVLFALALGVLVGTLVRRTVPAMAATLGSFIGVRVLLTLFARTHYMAAKTVTAPVSAQGGGVRFGFDDPAGAWILKQVTLDRAGAIAGPGAGFDLNYLNARCPGVIPRPGALPTQAKLASCLHRIGLHFVTTYQPGSRYWAFQGIEFGIYAALAVALFLTAGWIVRRRLG
jgi:ABC-type transport system involved in multi-copper enzyme maturation permease subunit